MSNEHKRNLAIPFFTQRDNTYVWQQKLESANGFYSIGYGRLIAVRNAEVENHGSNRFLRWLLYENFARTV